MGDDVYYVYIVRCEDDSLYTGIATDVVRRLREHLSQRDPGAKYTRTRKVVALEMVWRTHGRSAASKLEYRIKCLSHEGKLALVERPARAASDARLLVVHCGRSAGRGGPVSLLSAWGRGYRGMSARRVPRWLR